MAKRKTVEEINKLRSRLTKICYRCKKRKRVTSFSISKVNKDNRKSYCKPCSSEYYNGIRSAMKKKNPTWYRLRERKRKLKRYGLTVSDYNRMLKEQNFTCFICPTKYSTKKRRTLFVDHCHSTGKVRGLICDRCNRGLGSFRDSIINLESAISYLKKNG